jgi:hypothetical protein
MKKQLFLLTFLLSSYIGFAQEYVVTPNGLKNKSNVENSYLVIEAPDKSTTELYQNAIKFVNENYKNPEEVIKGKTEVVSLSKQQRHHKVNEKVLIFTSSRILNWTFATLKVIS